MGSCSTSFLRVWQTLFLVLMFCLSVSCASKTLRMAQVLYRHGDRAPEHLYPTYEHEAYWVEGLGQLTTKGMRQEYAMGRFLKSIYINETGLLNSTYIHKQVVCRSTNKDRTLMSAQTQLNGLYPPEGRQIWRPKLDWQPIPVQTLPSSEDHLLRPLGQTCPRYSALNTASQEGSEYARMEEENQDFLKWLATKTGKPFDFGEVYQVNDCMVTDQAHNLSLPEWANETVLAQLKEISGFTFNWNFVGAEKQKLTGGSLVGEMVSHMQQYQQYKGDPEKVKKMYLYSAHDSTILALQHALGVSDDISPPYSSVFMVELHGSDDSDLSVRMYYRLGQNNTRILKILPNCSADCPLADFISQTAAVVPDDIEAECLIPTSPPSPLPTDRPGTAKPGKGGGGGFKIGFIVVLVLLILLIIAVIAFCIWQRKHSQYSEVHKGAEPA